MKSVRTVAWTLACAGIVAASFLGCSKDSSSTPSGAAASASAVTTTTTTTATPVTIADSDLVTPADMEPQADSTITSANYKAQLASLETEMSKE